MKSSGRQRAMQWVTAAAIVAAPVALVVACGSSQGGGADRGSTQDAGANGALTADETLVGCTNDPRADTYQAGLAKLSQDGAMRVILLASDPAPPAFGTNSWTLRVEDTAGTAVAGAVIAATPFMPDHGHGSSIVPVVMDRGDGTYTVSIYFPMAGLWRIGLAVSRPDAGPASTVAFFYCVQH